MRGQAGCRCSGLTMAAITSVFTISRVAEILGKDEDWLLDISIKLEPEDGRITFYGTDATWRLSPLRAKGSKIYAT